jgi:hypothetical protein
MSASSVSDEQVQTRVTQRDGMTEPPKSLWERDLDDAKKALEAKLYRASILHSYLGVTGFIWDVLWGINNMWVYFPPQPGGPRYVKGRGEVTFPATTGGAAQMPCIDFVYRYVLPGEVMNQDLQLLRQANADLYRKLRSGTDEFELSKAHESGFIEPDEVQKVRALRSLRDLCSHFNPYSATILRYKESLRKLGIEPAESISDLSNVAASTVKMTSCLLETWKERTTHLCQKCARQDHKLSFLKSGLISRGDWTLEESAGGFGEEGKPTQGVPTPQFEQAYACKVRVCSNRRCNRFQINPPSITKRWNMCKICKIGFVKDVIITVARADDARVNVCRSVPCDWHTID